MPVGRPSHVASDRRHEFDHLSFAGRDKERQSSNKMFCLRCTRSLMRPTRGRSFGARGSGGMRTGTDVSSRYGRHSTPLHLSMSVILLSCISRLTDLDRHLSSLTRTPIRPSTQSLLPSSSLALSPPAPSIGSVLSTLDILPKISTHPALQTLQVRNGPRNTYDPSHRVRKRRAGFLARKRSRTGRNILVRRRQKRRSTLSH